MKSEGVVMRIGGMRLAAALAAAALLMALCPVPSLLAHAYTDTGEEPAAIQEAIDYVTNQGWMEGYEDGTFRPLDPVTRVDAARGLVCVFGHGSEPPVPGISFPDLPPSDARYRWANLAVYHGLMDITPDGKFLPDEPVVYERLAIEVTEGLGLEDVVANISNIVPDMPYYGGYMVVFHDLHLKYYDRAYPFSVRVWPGGNYPRGNMAFTLHKLDTLDSWRKDYLRKTFTAERCRPPAATDLQQTALEYGFERLGQAYLYGGESEGEGGFDCSGFVYNTLCMSMGYPMRRVADDQARDERYLYISREGLKPGDAIFWYDEEGGGATGHIGHAGMYVGNDLFIHSTGSNAGVSLDCLATNSYWSSHFAWGRRVVGGPYYNRFDEFLLLANPSEETASVLVEYLRPAEAPLSRDYSVAPHCRATIAVDQLLPYDEVSIHVSSNVGIVAERAMYFNYGGNTPGGDASIGAPATSLSWFLAEGYTGPGFATYLLLANPSDYEALARVSYLRETGGPLYVDYSLPPRSRTTVNVNLVPGMGATGVSMQVESANGVGIVAERAMYFDYQGLKGGSEGMGITQPGAQWFLAEGYTGTGFATYLLLANPSDADAQVDVDFLLEGKDKVTRRVTVAAHTRYTIDVNGEVPPGNVSARVTSVNDVPIVAERAMYFDYQGLQGGHASAGSTLSWFEWNFAEGYTGSSFDTWLLLANPGEADAEVTCSFLREDGSVLERGYKVPAGSRYTVAVDAIEGMEATAFATRVTSDQPIAAERAMYFEYNGWDGGSNSRGVAVPQRDWYFAEGYTGG